MCVVAAGAATDRESCTPETGNCISSIKGLKEKRCLSSCSLCFVPYCSYCLSLCKKMKMKIQRRCKINCLQREARACGQWTLVARYNVVMPVLAILSTARPLSFAIVWALERSGVACRRQMLLFFSSIIATPGSAALFSDTQNSRLRNSVIEYGVNLFAVPAKQIIDTHTLLL